MALSNILREPRREITESLVGLTVFGAAVWADYAFDAWFRDLDPPKTSQEAILGITLGMIVGVLLAAIVTFVLIVTHALGTAICNALEKRGVHLRPRQRPMK